MRRTLLLFAGAALLALIKLWLISTDEIVARPADAWYLISATRFYWGGTFADDAFLGLPAYPLWVAAVDRFGIPLRIAIELLQITAALAFAWCVVHLGHAVWAGLLVFAAIILHPVSFDLNNQVHPDTLYVPLTLFALAFIALQHQALARRAAVAWGTAAGLTVGVLWLTRPEAFLLWLLLAASALFAALPAVRGRGGWVASSRRAALAGVLPFLLAGGMVLVVRAVNHAQFGVFATSELTAPGFRAANRALLSIEPERRTAYVPLPSEARQRAYAASPALAQLRPFLEGSTWKGASAAADTSEIAGEFLPLALRDATRRAGRAASAREAEQFYRRIAQELRTACATGRLACRSAPHAFLPPDFAGAPARLAGSFLALGAGIFQPWQPLRERDDPHMAGAVVPLFNDVANRRPELARWPMATVSGWAFVPGDPLAEIALRDRAGNVHAATRQFSDRPDLPGGLPGVRNIPLSAGFAIDFPLMPAGELTVALTTRSGATFTMPVFGLMRTNRLTSLPGRHDTALQFNIEYVSAGRTAASGRPLHRLAEAIEGGLWTEYGRTLAVLSVLSLIALLGGRALNRPRPADEPGFLLAGLLAVAALLRFGTVAAIDSFAWPVGAYRYVYPAMILYGALIVLLLAHGVRMLLRPPQDPLHMPREHVLVSRSGAALPVSAPRDRTLPSET